MAKRSRRRFLTELAFLGCGTLAASLIVLRPSKTNAHNNEQVIAFESFPQSRTTDQVYSSAKVFCGHAVVDYHPKAMVKPGTAHRLRSDWNGLKIEPVMDMFFKSAETQDVTALVIGYWAGEDPEMSSSVVISKLVANKGLLPSLRALYLGDITSEECEMSWIQQSDLSPILENFPKLEVLRTRGSANLSISNPVHKNLRALAIESGGLDKSVVHSIAKADFPNLEYLELWLGTEDYGGNVTAEDLAPILSGELFPKLRYLGLRNYQKVDEIVPALVQSEVVQQIEELDLSLGMFSDAGAEAFRGFKSQKLQRLNLHHNYLRMEPIRMFQVWDIEVDFSKPEHMYNSDLEDRYIVVGE